jgi:predicted nuclease of predicted toxin-antitoxin system
LQKAITENRILVTLDEHFGDWVILPLSKHPGVIRLKINPTTSKNATNLLTPFLRLHSSGQTQCHCRGNCPSLMQKLIHCLA